MPGIIDDQPRRGWRRRGGLGPTHPARTHLSDELEGGAGLAELLGDAAVHAEDGPVDRGRQRQRVEVAVDRLPHRLPVGVAEGRHALRQEATVLVVQLRARRARRRASAP